MNEELLQAILSEVKGTRADLAEFKAETNQRLDALEARMDRVEARLDALEARMDSLEARMDSLEARMDKVEARLDTLETRFDRLEAKVDALDAKVDRQFADIAQAIYQVTTVIGDKIDANEKLMLQKIGELETVVAQNCYDIQYLRQRSASA